MLHSSDSSLGTEREMIMFGNIFQVHAPPGCWKSYPESALLFILCSLMLLPLSPQSPAPWHSVNRAHQQKLVISLSVGRILQLTETDKNYTERGQICKFNSPSFVSSNSMSEDHNTVWKRVTQCGFLRLGGTGASDPGGLIPSHALLFFPCSLLAATHLNLGCKLILTARGTGLTLLSVWHTVRAG